MAEFPIPEAATNPEFQSSKKGQFGVALEPEVVKICLYALGVGLVAGLVAQALLELIYLFTNIFFYGKFSFAITNPAHNHLGPWVDPHPSAGWPAGGHHDSLLGANAEGSRHSRGDGVGALWQEPHAHPRR